MGKEIWKSVPNYIGYEVSNLGGVRSIDREVIYKDGRVRRCKGVSLSTYIREGYNTVKIGGCRKGVHVLVAMAFLGHKPSGSTKGLVVDHIDNDPLNNNLNNLQVITQRKNSSKDRVGFSKYVGVDSHQGKWRARIRVGKKRFFLGRFTNEIDAHNAYQKKLEEISN
tara:strand:- start:23 stop:523 length:501 start_codon:yes stop_codon:yes gene_type:complete